MKRKSSLFGCLNKKGRHAERAARRVSASHLISVLESGEIPYQVRNDKCIFDDNHAFTLIELLVVVLIIGILAAVALPQYQKAVEKSKAAQAITLLKSVYQAADSYYLANGSWPIDFDELSLDLPWTEHVEAWAGLPARSDGDWSLQLRSGNYPGVLVTRLRGKYKGGMFLMYAKFGTVEDKTRTILCGELKIGDFKFEGDPGGFCQKLFGGTSKGGGEDTRLYFFK